MLVTNSQMWITLITLRKKKIMAIILKVLRVCVPKHQTAKLNAVKKGLKMQIYIEKLIEADEKGLIDWDKLGNQD